MISIFLFLSLSRVFIILLSTSRRGDTLKFAFHLFPISSPCYDSLYVLNHFLLRTGVRGVLSVNWVKLKFKSRKKNPWKFT